jgi:cell division protease FtsH
LDKEVGNISFYDSSGQSEYGFQKPFSEKTAEKIDAQIRTMVEEAYNKAKTMLSENKEKLDALANILIEKEVIFREDVENIYGKRPWDIEKADEQQE